ncbi:hypothetical protein [Erythrobacter sp. JK5]|uniref:hypothetical protein n=1 Tax=Erythrobacter sp. JK5 TaxID=2829500 RepID=UPI001BA9323F|nr:hypothetical protein [Erythrobacter sp. JK5]QUL36681.1 hypothetical protein KDC96_09595 [Erythrobacter sp. JK5]
MLKNILGAAIGSKVAKQSPVAGGIAGTAIATAIPMIVRRVSLPALAVLGVGGYFAKRFFDRRQSDGGTDAGDRIETPLRNASPAADTGTIIDPPPGGAANGTGKTGAANAPTT